MLLVVLQFLSTRRLFGRPRSTIPGPMCDWSFFNFCRPRNCSGWPGDLVPGPWESIAGPGRGVRRRSGGSPNPVSPYVLSRPDVGRVHGCIQPGTSCYATGPARGPSPGATGANPSSHYGHTNSDMQDFWIWGALERRGARNRTPGASPGPPGRPAT